MLKGQLTISFVLKLSLGFILMMALIYSTLALEDASKKETQRQLLKVVVKSVSREVFESMKVTEDNKIKKTLRLPLSKDFVSGQYSVELKDINGIIFVESQSMKWPDVIARQSLFLDSNTVLLNNRKQFPTKFCLGTQRNSTHYNITTGC